MVAAKNECGNESYVTVESLAKRFNSKSWKALSDPDSVISKILTSGNLKNSESSQTENQIDFNLLAAMVAIYTRGDPSDKALILYNVL